METNFPWEGKVEYTIHPKKQGDGFAFAVRIPSYAKECTILLNGRNISGSEEKVLQEKDGYLYLTGEMDGRRASQH